MSVDDVALALTVAEQVHPFAPLALRSAAVSGARRSELAGLRWDRVVDGQLIINQAITIDRTHPVGDPERLHVSPWIVGEDEHPPSPDKIGWWWKRTSRADQGRAGRSLQGVTIECLDGRTALL